MPTVLHELVVSRPRDLFRARQRARQIAGTLRFSPHEQMLFAVTVFDLACQGWRRQGQVTLRFLLDDDRLQVWPHNTTPEADDDEPAIHLDEGAPGAGAVWDVTAFQKLLRRLRDRPSMEDPLLDMPVRCQSFSVSRDDLPWVIEQLAEVTPLRLLDEIEQHNADLLLLLHQVQGARESARPNQQPAAA
jgi:hypothetical protein